MTILHRTYLFDFLIQFREYCGIGHVFSKYHMLNLMGKIKKQ